MGRMSDISRGPQLAAEYAVYQAWLKKTAEQKQVAYRAVAKPKTARVKSAKVPIYVVPFNLGKDGISYETKGLSKTQSGAGSDIAGVARDIIGTGRFDETAPTGTDISILVPNYRFAKIKIKNRSGGVDENHKSRITNRPYDYYPTNNVSMNFGKATGDLNYQDAVDTMKASAPYKTFASEPGNHVGFTPEGA
jgi:hypothetical protein